MSARSWQRALGETSLEAKCLFFFGLALLIVITVSFLLYWIVTEEVVYGQNSTKGRLLADQTMLIRHWERLETNETFLPYLEHLSENLSNQQYSWRLIHPPGCQARDPGLIGKPRDAFEEELLDRFLQPPEDTGKKRVDFAERYVSDGEEYQYYQAIRAQRSCLSVCHTAPPVSGGFYSTASGLILWPSPLRDGDLMAMVQVTIPNGPTQAMVTETWNWLVAVSIVTAFLALAAFYVVIRYVIIRPLRHLRNVSEAISQGNTSLRAELHTGDEFESLAVVFNRMLRHLVSMHEELRQVNADLDAKVDELARLNMQLYEMNRLKSDFMATMSHELRTPLNSILGFSELLADSPELDERRKRFVRNIQKAGRMLLEMINNILDLAKIESGKMEVHLVDFDIAQLVQAQCDLARPLAEKKNLALQTDVPADLPPMRQDQGRVHQVLNNLLSNAVKFTPEGGRIKVVVRRNDQDKLVLQVSDTGVGIAEEDRQVIFEKFRQGHTTMPNGDVITREHSGSGLGLSIVRELCTLLGGEVSVESELGAGSTFTVRLPWRLQQPPRLESPGTAEIEAFSHSALSRRAIPAAAGDPEQSSTAGLMPEGDETVL